MIDLTDEKIEEIKTRLEKLTKTKIKSKKIKSIVVNPTNRFQPKMIIEVGQICKYLEVDAPPEEVLLIFESMSFMVVTESHGLNDGLPYIFYRGDVKRVEKY